MMLLCYCLFIFLFLFFICQVRVFLLFMKRASRLTYVCQLRIFKYGKERIVVCLRSFLKVDLGC